MVALVQSHTYNHGITNYSSFCKISQYNQLFLPLFIPPSVHVCNTQGGTIPGGIDSGGGGVLNFGFGREVPPGNLKHHPCKYQLSRKKGPINVPNHLNFESNSYKLTIFGKNLRNFSQNFQFFKRKLEKMSNFEKLTHQNTNFYTEKGPIDIPESLI